MCIQFLCVFTFMQSITFIKANAVFLFCFSDVCDSFWPDLDQGKQTLKPSIYSTFSQRGVLNMLYIGLKGNIPIILLHVHKAAFHFHTVIIKYMSK